MKNFKFKLSTIKYIFKILKYIFNSQKKYIFIIVFITLISSILPFINLLNTQNIINTIQTINKNKIETLIPFIVTFLILGIILELIPILNDYYLNKLNQMLSYHFNSLVLKKTNELKLEDFENSNMYDSLQRAEQEAGLRPYKIITSFLALIKNILKFSISIIILYSWHKLSVLIIIVLPVIFSVYFFKINKDEYLVFLNRTKYERKTWYIAYLLEKDIYIKEVKILDLFNHLFSLYKETKMKFIVENLKLLKKRANYTFIFQCIINILISVIAILAMLEACLGKILIGTMSTLITTLSNLENTIREIINLFFALYQDGLFVSNLIDFLEYKPSDTSINNKVFEKINKIEKIELINLSYRYDSKTSYVLKNINLKIKKGEKIALVGQNGSGKSTLIKIILGLYLNYEGKILINGINLRNINPKLYREKISTVFQDFNKYEFTVKENIGYGDISNISDKKRMEIALKNSEAFDFVKSLPSELDQQVGNWFENGTQLSGGQWQKLAISRAFFRNADLYIFDEPTAALDPISEYNTFKKFFELINDKIGIFITHRFNNVHFANKIIVLDNGEIMESGTHEELMVKKELYYKFYNIQNKKMNYKEKS